MAKRDIKVGDKVRTTEEYGELFENKNYAGVEFTVTRVSEEKTALGDGTILETVVYGDPWGYAVWGNFLEKVEDEA
ncbi:hypothetical protein SEA_JACKO_104 [Microbacterium phage Jacko]|nr:hypothetical protein SEA_JACKO_104 [Microbacterium phage Jacko]